MRRESKSSGQRRSRRFASAGLLMALLGGVTLLAGCGASSSSATYAPIDSHMSAGAASSASSRAGGSVGATSTSNGSNAPNASNSPQTAQSVGVYLIKSLGIAMAVPDTRATATDLESWIASTDLRSQSAGATYSQDGDAYDVTLRFVVQASLYPQIEAYLRDYAGGHKGKLINLQENVQDVTNDYIDTQAQLSNLLAEEKRLETLMSQAQSVGDLVTIEQRISDVQGQIQQINAHLSQLSGQTTYYTVQVTLTPLATYVSPAPIAWDPGGVFHEALASARGFGQGLLTVLIWLAVYAIYLLPVGVIVWLVVRYRRQRTARQAGLASSAPPPSA